MIPVLEIIGDKIVISLDIETLVKAAENLPGNKMTVLNSTNFARNVLKQIDTYATTSDESIGNTAFQTFLDNVFEQVAEESDSVELIEQ